MVAGGLLLTPATAGAAAVPGTAGPRAASLPVSVAGIAAPGTGVTVAETGAAGTTAPGTGVSVVGTVASVRAADASLVVNRAYRFRDSRPKTVRFTLNSGTAVVVNGATARIGAVRAGMQVTVTGTQTGATAVATRVVVRR